MKKRILALFLILILVLSVTACRKKDKKEDIPEISVSTSSEIIPVIPSADSSVNGSDISSSITEEPSGSEEQSPSVLPVEPSEDTEDLPVLDVDGYYYSAEDVALYIHTYGRLPSNFITKKEAQKLGWTGGSVDKYKKGGAIGGDYFGNYQGLLPKGHTYHECDINTKGKKSRGPERIIFSDDGLIYYTADHYKSFILLYGEE